jgi:hypothetical protein
MAVIQGVGQETPVPPYVHAAAGGPGPVEPPSLREGPVSGLSEGMVQVTWTRSRSGAAHRPALRASMSQSWTVEVVCQRRVSILQPSLMLFALGAGFLKGPPLATPLKSVF